MFTPTGMTIAMKLYTYDPAPNPRRLELFLKYKRLSLDSQQVDVDVDFAAALGERQDAYERLIGDALIGSLRRFARQDIVEGTRKLVALAQAGEISAKDITSEFLQKHMSTSGLPDVDLLIRTGGESRISDFLLFEAAYAELHFVNVMWPEFRAHHFEEALDHYRGIERRYGLTTDQVKGGELSVVG